MARQRPFNPWRDRADEVERLLRAREEGATLRQAAAAAGLHVATVCRWAARSSTFRQALDDAAECWARAAYLERLRQPLPPQGRKPPVPWRCDCPACGAAVDVRTARGRWPFWRCSRWPECRWASWRPRAEPDCPACGGPTFWSHSRKNISCGRCRRRVFVGK